MLCLPSAETWWVSVSWFISLPEHTRVSSCLMMQLCEMVENFRSDQHFRASAEDCLTEASPSHDSIDSDVSHLDPSVFENDSLVLKLCSLGSNMCSCVMHDPCIQVSVPWKESTMLTMLTLKDVLSRCFWPTKTTLYLTLGQKKTNTFSSFHVSHFIQVHEASD